jgi:hypothetical protein
VEVDGIVTQIMRIGWTDPKARINDEEPSAGEFHPD